jgi:hypothetical protein
MDRITERINRDFQFDFMSSHQYYRQSRAVRGILATAMGATPVT